MGIDGIGSSVIIALAAVMWFLYLIPTWFKRQEYLATERNAVRLQQTMRILAESAEMPSVVRVEATARTVAAQQRALRMQQRNTARTVFARTTESISDQAQRTVDSGARTRRRLRRSRALATIVLMVSLAGVGFGMPAATAGNWLLLLVSVAVGAGSIALLGQAATVTRARTDLRRASLASASPSALHDQADYAPQRPAGWTPVPIPKPLYLSGLAPAPRSAVSHVSAQPRSTEVAAEFDHAAALRAASVESERALRAAQAAPEVARISRPVQAPAEAPSRFASMGVLDPNASNATDLDEILRRRRAAG
ncbi:MAG: hypothetical protein ABIW32_09715 [Terrimesophilobacter sp.]